MQASIKEAAKTPEFPPTTLAVTIRSEGYEWHLKEARRARVPYRETVSEVSRMLQICGVTFVCFN